MKSNCLPQGGHTLHHFELLSTKTSYLHRDIIEFP